MVHHNVAGEKSAINAKFLRYQVSNLRFPIQTLNQLPKYVCVDLNISSR